MRIFLAINLPDFIRYELEAMIDEAQKLNKYDFIRWTKPRSLHLTLNFLGKQDQNNINNLIKVCQSVAQKFSPINLKTGDWGGFPNLLNPKIIYLGLNNCQEVKNLQCALGNELENSGFEIDKREFNCHITMARNKNPHQSIQLSLPELTPQKFEINSFELMKSNLLSEGAEYEVLETFSLEK